MTTTRITSRALATAPVPMYGSDESLLQDSDPLQGLVAFSRHLKANSPVAVYAADNSATSLCLSRRMFKKEMFVDTFELPSSGIWATGQVIEKFKSPETKCLKALYDAVVHLHFAARKTAAEGESTRPISIWSWGTTGDEMSRGRWLPATTCDLATTVAQLVSANNQTGPTNEWKRRYEKLDALKLLDTGWDSYNAAAPAVTVLRSAHEFLCQLQDADLLPARIAPSVVGGVGFTFKCDVRKVYVEFKNAGTVYALFSDGMTDPIVKQIESNDAGYADLITRIKKYINE